MAAKRIKAIEFFAPMRSSWIETDFKILSGLAEIRFVKVSWRSFPRWLFESHPFDLGYFWFGSYWHLPYLIVTKLLGKKIVIVAGGYDVNGVPEIKYGAFEQSRLKRALRRFVFSFADQILAVSNFTEHLVLKNLGVAKSRVRMIYLPIAVPQVSPAPWVHRARQVAFLISSDEDNRLVKGLDRIPELCRRLADVKFKLAGALTEPVRRELEAAQIQNLELLGPLPFHSEAFFELLNSSRVICAPSRSESFGAALADGALMGCIPIGFDVGAIPEVLGGAGALVPAGDCMAMAEAIRNALDQSEALSKDQIATIRDRFSPHVRAARLKELIGDLEEVE